MGIKKGTKLPHLLGENSNHWKGGMIEKKCKFCMKKFSVHKYRKDTALFCSVSCFAKSSTGSNGKNWRGGLSEINGEVRRGEKYNEWRKSVYKRDMWTCQKCFKKQKHPIAHHIMPFKDYPELRFDIDNGITVCRSCHLRIHEEIGFNTRFVSKSKNLTIK